MGGSKGRSKRNAKRDALYALDAQQVADDFQKWKWYYYVKNAIVFLLCLPFCIVFTPVAIIFNIIFPEIPHDGWRYPHLYRQRMDRVFILAIVLILATLTQLPILALIMAIILVLLVVIL